MPDEIGGSHMAKLVVRPEVIRFLDLISGLSADKLRLEELSFEQMRSDLHGRASASLTFAPSPGPPSLACATPTAPCCSPAADYVPVDGDVLLVLGSEEQIESFEVRFRQL